MEIRDYFISYNNAKDSERAAWVAHTLRDCGFKVYFQGEDCKPGMNFPRWMADAIQHSRGLIAIWSSAYELSDYCQDEWNAAYVKHHKDKSYVLLPVRFSDTPIQNALFSQTVAVDLLSPDESRNRATLLRAVGYDVSKSENSAALPGRVSDDDKCHAKEAYFKYLSNTLGELQFEGIPTDQKGGAVKVPLEQVFVPLMYVPFEFQNEEKSWEDSHHKRDEQEKNIYYVLTQYPHSAILAKPGGGKSTLIRRIALAYADPRRRGQVEDGLPDMDWFPVYLRCRDLHGNVTKSIGEIITSIAVRAERKEYQEAFLALAEEARNSGKMLLLIDGLDEISSEQDRLRFVEQLHTFIDAWPTVHLMLTSREAGFRSVAGTLASYCGQFSISSLNEEQIRALSLKWHQALMDDIFQAAEESTRVSDMILKDARIQALAGNPLLLTTLLFVKRWVGYLPTQKTRLYQEMVKLLLVSWNATAHEKLDLDETEPQLAYVAYIMTKEGKQTISKKKLERCIIEARHAMPDLLSYTKVSPAQFIDLVESRSSLLIMKGLEENDQGILMPAYEFSHLSFQEYLTARAVVEQWLPVEDCAAPSEQVRLHLREVQWVEIIPLMAVLSGRGALRIIQFLLQDAETFLETDSRKIESHPGSQISGNVSALHLANCIAHEVAMGPDVLKKSLIVAVRNIRYITNFGEHLKGRIDVFSLILNSKYASDYQEAVRTNLFGKIEMTDLPHFSAAWRQITSHKLILELDSILSFLHSKSREDMISGVYYMEEYSNYIVASRENQHVIQRDTLPSIAVIGQNMDSYRSNIILQPIQDALLINENQAELIADIFSIILHLLQSADFLCAYAAAWCVALSGYNDADIIPGDLVKPIINQLFILWNDNNIPTDCRTAFVCGIESSFSPILQILDLHEFRPEMVDVLKRSNNPWDLVVAVYLGITSCQMSESEIYEILNRLPDSERNRRFLRELGYVGRDGQLISKDGDTVRNENQ